jgi:hypothetical protein
MTGREKRFLLRFLAGEALALLGLAIIYFAFPDAVAATFFGVGVSFVGAEVATFSVYGCVLRLQRESLRGVFALFGVVGWLFFPYVSYYVGLVVGLGPDFSPVGAAPGIDAYDVAGVILWIAGGSILFAWPASLLLAVHHRKRFGL